MKNIISKILSSKFIKNVAIMATGAAGAQVITMLFSPIITRLYGPEAYGILGTFTALTRVIIPVAALTYPIAIVLPKNDRNAKGIIKLSLYISLFISILTLLFILIFNKIIVSTFNIDEIASFLYLIPLVIVFSSVMQVSEQWLIRTNQFSINAKVTFFQSLITNFLKVGIGIFYPLAIILVILQATANGLKAFMMAIFIKKSNRKDVNDISEENLSVKQLSKKHYDFPLYRAPEEFISSLSHNLPVVLLTSLFGPASAGFYSIGRTVLGLPSRLVGQAVGDVFYPRITEAANNKEDISKLLLKATLSLIAVGIIPFGIIILFGPILFEFVFGEDWNMAGQYARWIALWSYGTFINKPSIRSMPVLSAQRFHLIFTSLRLVISSAALLIGFLTFKDDIIAVALFGFSGLILNMILIIITLKISKRIMKN